MPLSRTHIFRLAQRRGSVVVFAAICLVVVILFLALSIDIGYVVVAGSNLQHAADAGAMSGARALPQGRSQAISAAKTWAGKNLAAGETVVVEDGDVEIGRWDESTAAFIVIPVDSPAVPNSVRVTCQRTAARGNPLRLLFAPVLGTDSADLTTIATAKIERDICGLFVGIQQVELQNATVDSYNSSDGAYEEASASENGDVCSNGPITLSPQGFVHGDARPGENHSVNRPNQVSGSIDPPSHRIRWSDVDTLGPSQANNNGAIPEWALTNNGHRIVVEGERTLELPPGTYYLREGLRAAGSGRIVITGPTKLVLGGDVTIEGTGVVNRTSVPASLRIEMVSTSARLAGSAALYADIYAPTTRITVGGNGGFYGAIFADRINAEGSNAALHGDEALRERFDDYTSQVSLRQ